MMSRDNNHFRDRLMLVSECKPCNVKRKSQSTRHQSLKGSTGPKLSMQDFVRMDPGYTADIEHLVFPGKRRNSQQVAPVATSTPGKTRSRLAEMFALSRHLQQRSADREIKTRSMVTNRSVDSVLDPRKSSKSSVGGVAGTGRWQTAAAVEEPVRQSSHSGSRSASVVVETDMSAARGPNVSVLHLRNVSEPWESTPTSIFTSVDRQYPSIRSTASTRPLTKHQSLAGPPNAQSKWNSYAGFHSGEEINSTDMFVAGSCNRELSPVRWCDREVDGVYLGRSGWVQVQQRSLDENRRTGYRETASLQSNRRTGIKLAQYHCNSEPGKYSEISRLQDSQRPLYLSLQTREFENKARTPSPRVIPESFSPPSVTPIISPPPAFQDKNKTVTKSRTFFGKAPFLPRSNAIEDSDASPPSSPIPAPKKPLQPPAQPISSQRLRSPLMEKAQRVQIPQTKSLESADASSNRRNQFTHRFGESPTSSASSNVGFRSLDSCVNRPAMPRLSENTDSSIDVEVYEDADDEDNNSSLSLVSSVIVPVETVVVTRAKEKLSPSGRSSRTVHHRSQTRRSPVGSDTQNKQGRSNSSSSSSSSSPELKGRSPSNTLRRSNQSRTTQNNKQSQDEASLQKVKRSRSLQLPERKVSGGYKDTVHRISPQQHPEAHKVIVKVGNVQERPKKILPQHHKSTEETLLDENMIREAEVVTEYLYGSRSRAAAQALIMHRYNNVRDNNKSPIFVGGNNKNRERQKVLQRGSTTPNLPSSRTAFGTAQDSKNYLCNSENCGFWPHCMHQRQGLGNQAHQPSMMRVSQSYPSHQRSLDSAKIEITRPSTATDRPTQDFYKRKYLNSAPVRDSERRLSPNRRSPVTIKRLSPNSSNSSSSSDIWVTTSDRTVTRSPRTAKGSGTSTPLDEVPGISTPREMILTRPGSAPAKPSDAKVLEAQQRSLSLPKSFLSVGSYPHGGQVSWRRHGTESLRSSPGLCRKTTVVGETSHTAPVTPSHESDRRRSPLPGSTTSSGRRAKASSTPQLLDAPSQDNRRWSEKQAGSEELDSRLDPPDMKELHCNRNGNAESVLQKFRKTFSLHFQKRGSKESGSSDMGEALSEILAAEPSEEDSPQHQPQLMDAKEEQAEQKYRFGPLKWRTSKERKKMNKAARNAKCNSGDSGIQIEMAPGSGGGGGESSESHDTDPPGDEEVDSPPPIRRRPPHGGKSSRPHSDLLNQILIDKFKAELKSRAHRHNQVRRTHSDLGGQRLLQWDPRNAYRRLMSSPVPLKTRPQSPRKKPPDLPGGVQLRGLMIPRRGQLRRSLSQPLDIDKLSPLMRNKSTALRLGGPAVFSEDEHDTRGGGGTSEDEMMASDSESSLVSLNERKKSLELAMDEDVVILAEAVFDHVAIEAEELAFRAGDVIEVLQTEYRDWWWGSADGKTGWFPAAFVRLRVSQEDTVEDCLEAMASGKSVPAHLRRRTSISLLSNDQVRTSVVRELVNTERDFVKVLQDVAEGYIAECRKRTNMFTKEQIETIFINLEDILKFQTSFLKDLEACINWDAPYKSCVGSCFLKHRSGFKMYSDYCNSHPVATATLQELYQFSNYSKFFEACRLMRGLIEIPLDGYLLTPVQRICKYPLQLAELLKYTKPDHLDYGDVKEALEAMRDVATLINERKRRMESLEKLAAWQQRVEGWEGEDLIETSSQLIHQGEVVRVTTGMWTSNITLFLFDHQVVYCKKDILKRSTYVYKGRICLDTTEIIDVPDGKDIHIGVTVRHAIKLYSCLRDKWLLFCCRSASEKKKWLDALAEERRMIAQDRSDGLEFPPAAKQLARVAAKCQRRPPRKLRAGKNYKHGSAYMGSTLHLNPNIPNSNSLGRKMGTWFTFGGSKKTRHRDVS